MNHHMNNHHHQVAVEAVEAAASTKNMIHWIDRIWQMVVWVENELNIHNIKINK
jgi:hypothetical protein